MGASHNDKVSLKTTVQHVTKIDANAKTLVMYIKYFVSHRIIIKYNANIHAASEINAKHTCLENRNVISFTTKK